MQITSRSLLMSYTMLLTALVFTIFFWFQARDVQAEWINVPPVPSETGALSFSIGDKQMAYRSFGLMLQNIGNIGGRSAALDSYNFDMLSGWFLLEDGLDPESDYVPMLAAYYFGGTPDETQLDPVIEYLATVGQRKGKEKWRWLAHAVYLSRFKQKDLDKALELSYILAAKAERENLPHWAKQMPAFILSQQGDKQAAKELLLTMLKENAEKMHPNEVNFTVDYICTRILDKSEAAEMPLCDAAK